MYVKKNFNKFIIPLLLSTIIFSSCRSTPSGYDYGTSGIPEANQRAIEQLKTTESNLGFINESTREQLRVIREESDAIGDTIERVCYLFSKYEQLVNEILYSIERERQSLNREGEGDK